MARRARHRCPPRERDGFRALVARITDHLHQEHRLPPATQLGMYSALRYTAGGKHSLHSDHDLDSVLSVSVNLSAPDEYKGGQLHFYKPHLRVDNMRQMGFHNHRHHHGRRRYEPHSTASAERFHATAFHSHALHELTPLTGGTRLVITLWYDAEAPAPPPSPSARE